MRDKNISKKVALTGMLCALAAAISFLESLIPSVSGFPPGAKPGFSNLVIMFSAASLGIGQTFIITIFKAVFAGVTRGVTAFFMSLAGGLLSTGAALLLLRRNKLKLGFIGIGIICAVCHNAAQLCVACVIAGTSKFFVSYGSPLLIFAAVTGFLTGTALKYILPVLNKQIKHIMKDSNQQKGLNE